MRQHVRPLTSITVWSARVVLCVFENGCYQYHHIDVLSTKCTQRSCYKEFMHMHFIQTYIHSRHWFTTHLWWWAVPNSELVACCTWSTNSKLIMKNNFGGWWSFQAMLPQFRKLAKVGQSLYSNFWSMASCIFIWHCIVLIMPQWFQVIIITHLNVFCIYYC